MKSFLKIFFGERKTDEKKDLVPDEMKFGEWAKGQIKQMAKLKAKLFL